MSVELDARVPNNVDLSRDRRLRRALESWQPKFLEWWRDTGPLGFDGAEVYLRTPVDVGDGWANFGFTKMADYRWGIFLAPPEKDRRIGFGDHYGEPVWQEIPGEYRAPLRRLIVTQADTEPASVEQQRRLGRTCPSLYDLRNLFQVNVEEGRHLWAMVYLLHSHFGRDGREEAEGLLARRAGGEDQPRILGAFNEPCEDWLSFFFYTFFMDRDGKFQLLCLAESAFDPLSRSCRFMLTEEAHHLFVGLTGIQRVVARSAALEKQGDVRALGGIDLPTVQKYLNFWFSWALDLFGGEVSTNAASAFAQGLKGRPQEEKYPDHLLRDGAMPLQVWERGRRRTREVPLRNAVNEMVRDAYIADCQLGVDKWNDELAEQGSPFRLALPDRRFQRRIGAYAGLHFDPSGNPIDETEWVRRRDEWLPSASDRAWLADLMSKPVHEPGKMANWIAPPRKGIDRKPVDFEYVRF